MDRMIETPDKANAVFRAGINLKLRDDNPDYPALVLGNYLVGGSSDARLARRVREKDGLSYSVGSWINASSMDEAGEFGVYAIYAPQNRTRLEQAIREELARALADGFTAAEFESARKGLLEARKVARNNDATLAGRLLSYAVVGRTFKWDAEFDARIAALTPDEVRAALRRHLRPEQLSIVKAGDFTKVAGKGH
jgi:zinc protease